MATYYEMLIKGDDEMVRAYLKGFLAGRRIHTGFMFSRDHPVELHQVSELIKFKGEVAHLIVEARLRATVTAALKRAQADYGFELKRTRRIKHASFKFDYKTANRKVATSVKRILSRMPAGVKLEESKRKEVVHPDARGAEAYAPLHEYEFKGKGAVRGEPFAVLRVRERMSANTAFHVDEVKIRH